MHSVLKKPIYAGAYTYGRSKTTTRLEAGQKRVFRQKKNRREDLLIMDHHEGYIDWNVYQSNQTIVDASEKRGILAGVGRGQ